MNYREIKFKIEIEATEFVNGHQKGDKLTLINDIFNVQNGLAYFSLNKEWKINLIAQFTEMSDINGAHIFEGDIVKLANDEPYGDIEPEFTGTVKMICGQWVVDGIGTGHPLWQEIAQWEVIKTIL